MLVGRGSRIPVLLASGASKAINEGSRASLPFPKVLNVYQKDKTPDLKYACQLFCITGRREDFFKNRKSVVDVAKQFDALFSGELIQHEEEKQEQKNLDLQALIKKFEMSEFKESEESRRESEDKGVKGLIKKYQAFSLRR